MPSSSLSGVCSLILFPLFATGVNDNGGKFAAGVIDTGGNLPPASLPPAANLPPVSLTPVANNGKNIRLQTPESELEGKNLYICFLYYCRVIDTGDNLPPVSLTPGANLAPVSLTPVAHLDLRISPRIFEKIPNDPNVIIRGLGEGDS